MTRIFFDTEFTGLHQNTTLISIGMIADSGQTFYAELIDYNKNQIDSWLEENVIKNLHLEHTAYDNELPTMTASGKDWTIIGNSWQVLALLREWLGGFESVEIWSDCLSYDWVLFCELFGGAMKIPNNIYYIPFDICTIFKLKGIDADINRELYSETSGSKHNSLHDARVIKACYEKLSRTK